MTPKIVHEANKAVQKCRFETEQKGPSNIAIDARWSHRRNGSQCTVTAMDIATGKAVTYSNVVKIRRKRQGDYS